ncbi:MAG: hypothetical protein M1839_002164 [Geoglossum umbratile]|nr:MAG: hypothetical protein M1839_002164 [Geoglossum umbratile]
MFVLDDKQKNIIRDYPIGNDLEGFCKSYSRFVSKSFSRPSCEEIAGSVITDKGARQLIRKLLGILLAAGELPACRGSLHEFLSDDIAAFYNRYPERVNIEAIAILLKRAVTEPVDEEALWSAAYDLLTPQTPPREQSTSKWPDRHVLSDLQKDWLREYVPDSFFALERLISNYNQTAWVAQYYSRTLVFVQSSGLGKSRLVDIFGKSCPMINLILRKSGTRGYPG